MPSKKTKTRLVAGIAVAAVVLAVAGYAVWQALGAKEHNATTFAMDTIITQTAYGPHAQEAMRQVNLALAGYEKRLSLFAPESDIARINAAAGAGGAAVSPETAALLTHALALSRQSEGAFAVTVAPLTTAWGITSTHPRVVPEAERQALVALVDDEAVVIEGNRVTLPRAGMGIDLGGIAKGAACDIAADIYRQNGVTSAVLSIGGNVYTMGTKPDGTPFRIGFRDPTRGSGAYIASFTLTDAVVAVSGGYERYFEEDGHRYIHIMNPETGAPAESDILSVGVIHPDGATADFYSTTLYVWGRERALAYMRGGGQAILLDNTNTLYVSESLRDGFALHEGVSAYTVVYVPEDGHEA